MCLKYITWNTIHLVLLISSPNIYFTHRSVDICFYSLGDSEKYPECNMFDTLLSTYNIMFLLIMDSKKLLQHNLMQKYIALKIHVDHQISSVFGVMIDILRNLEYYKYRYTDICLEHGKAMRRGNTSLSIHGQNIVSRLKQHLYNIKNERTCYI